MKLFYGRDRFKSAYYSVSISRLFQIFLKFKWKDKLHCFICFPGDLGSYQRKFTKLNQAPIKTLHFENVPLGGYDDNFFIKRDSFSIFEKNIHKAMLLYNILGFAINFKKSGIVPTERIRILSLRTRMVASKY